MFTKREQLLHQESAGMSFQLKNEWYVKSPIQKLAVKVTLTGQADDDWYRLEICSMDEPDKLGAPIYPLKTSRLLRNINEVKFSRNGLTLVALEFDGSVVAWRQGPTGTYAGVGQQLYVGSAIYGLEVADSGTSISVHIHLGGTQTWMYRPEVGEFS